MSEERSGTLISVLEWFSRIVGAPSKSFLVQLNLPGHVSLIINWLLSVAME